MFVNLTRLAKWQKKRLTQITCSCYPDSEIWQIVTAVSILITVENNGEAIDEVRLEVKLDEGETIEHLMFQEPENTEITWGGEGINEVHFILKELWPNSYQYIEIISSSGNHTPAQIKGYSVNTGVLEERAPFIVLPIIQ